MIIHNRFQFECGGFVDIKRKPLEDMSPQARHEFILTLKHIQDLFKLKYEYEMLDNSLQELSERGA